MLRRRRVTQYDAVPPSRPLLWPWLVVLLALVIGGIAAAYFLTRDNATSATKTQVPDVVGLSTAFAVQKLGQRGYPAVVEGRVRPGARLGTVLSETPPAGAELDRGEQVTIIVARGPSTIEVPNIVGLSVAEAYTRLEAVGLKGKAAQVASTEPKGRIVKQAPGGGSEVTKKSTILLSVSNGPAPVIVPSVTGKSETDAKAALAKRGLLSGSSRVASSKPVGTVITQQPAPGSKVQKGSVVALSVSGGSTPTTTGPSLTPPKGVVVVPRVVGKGQSAAAINLENKGLKVDSYPVASSRPRGTVVSQRPAGGTKVPSGSRVRINVSLGAGPRPTRAVPDVTGQNERAARQTLILVGFTVRTIDRPATNPADNGIVLDQKPAAGKRAPAGSQILIYVGRAPTPTG